MLFAGSYEQSAEAKGICTVAKIASDKKSKCYKSSPENISNEVLEFYDKIGPAADHREHWIAADQPLWLNTSPFILAFSRVGRL